jgi:hypothetical protein
MVPCVGGDKLDIPGRGACPAQVAAAQLVASEDRVGVSVDESGKKGATRQVYEIGPGIRAGGPDRHNLTAPNSNTGALRKESGAVENSAVAENHLICHRHCCTP